MANHGGLDASVYADVIRSSAASAQNMPWDADRFIDSVHDLFSKIDVNGDGVLANLEVASAAKNGFKSETHEEEKALSLLAEHYQFFAAASKVNSCTVEKYSDCVGPDTGITRASFQQMEAALRGQTDFKPIFFQKAPVEGPGLITGEVIGSSLAGVAGLAWGAGLGPVQAVLGFVGGMGATWAAIHYGAQEIGQLRMANAFRENWGPEAKKLMQELKST